jgi:hypothetical protein
METENQKINLSEEETAKVQWIIQLYSTIKELQREIEKRERSKRYISIFVSGCLTFFIVKILQHLMQSQSDAIVFFSAFVTLCMHYIVDNVTNTWNRIAGLRKFQKSLQELETERLKLNIEEKDLMFGPIEKEEDE